MKTKKVVFCQTHDGFGITINLRARCKKLSGLDVQYDDWQNIKRDDPFLIKAIEDMRNENDGHLFHLKIVEIPIDMEYKVINYDDKEFLVDKNRCWE